RGERPAPSRPETAARAVDWAVQVGMIGPCRRWREPARLRGAGPRDPEPFDHRLQRRTLHSQPGGGAARAASAIHGWSQGSSRFGLPSLSWSATSSTPAVRRVLLTSSSPTTSAFTLAIQARLPASGSTNGFTWGYPVRRGRHSLMLWPSRLRAPLGPSTLP